MRRLVVGLVLASGAACLDFDARVDAGCDLGAPWDECDAGTGGGAPDAGNPDAGADAGTDDAGTDAGTDAGPDAGPDAGTDAGTGDAGVDVACRGAGGWCWEHPLPFGAGSLIAIAGTGDSDLWVGGTGPTLLHFDGVFWTDALARRPVTPLVGSREPPTVRGLALSDAGTLWIAGDRMRSVGYLSNGSPRNGPADTTHVAAASGYGLVALAGADSNNWVLDVSSDDSNWLTTFLPADINQIVDVEVTPTDVLVAYERADHSAHVWRLSSLRASSLASDAGPCFQPSTLAWARGTAWVSCDQGLLFGEGTDGGWVQRQSVVVPYRIDSMAFWDLDDGGLARVFGCEGGAVVTDRGPGTPESRTDYSLGLTDFSAAWWSPAGGGAWLSGSGGRLVYATPDFVQERGSAPRGNIVELAVRGDVAIADDSDGYRHVRDPLSGKWSSSLLAFPTESWAVALGPDGGACRLDERGAVWCDGTQRFSFEPLFDGGRPVEEERRAGLRFDEAGRLRAAVGGWAALELEDGGWDARPMPDGRGHTADLSPWGAGLWVATNGGSSYALRDGGAAWFDPDGGTEFCATPRPALGIVALDAGVALVVGPDFIGECVGAQFRPAGIMPSGGWTSAWVDPFGRSWVISREGLLVRRSPGFTSWELQEIPLSTEPGDYVRVTRITGTDTHLYVGHGRGGILRRPLP